jgi:hypothetical protein
MSRGRSSHPTTPAATNPALSLRSVLLFPRAFTLAICRERLRVRFENRPPGSVFRKIARIIYDLDILTRRPSIAVGNLSIM